MRGPVFSLIFAALLFLCQACAISLKSPAAIAPQLRLVSAASTVASYTCALVTLSATYANGNAWTAPANLSVTLSGLGSGNAFSTLANCKTGTSATSTVFISAGSSSTTFYFRTSVAENLQLGASATTGGMETANLSLTTTLFQTLGQDGPTHLSAFEKGQNSSASVLIVGSRLFVTEYGNHRVLVWNSIPTSSYQAPDYVLGQPDLKTVSSGISAIKMNSPTGLYSDGTRLFVSDTANSRILVWNSIPTTTQQPADFALGQPDLVTNTGGTGASGMNNPWGIAGTGTKLFVADTYNSRILIWNSISGAFAQAADNELGQPNFTNNALNNGGIADISLYFPMGIHINGTALYVADYGNNRVMGWNTIPTALRQPADFVLGQPGFTVNTVNNGGISASTMSSPGGVYSDGTRFFVTDQYNNRILGWNTIPSTSSVAADFVLGQSNFTTNTANSGGISASSLYRPFGMFHSGTKLFVADYANSRTLIYNAINGANTQAADLVLGQPTMATNTANYPVVSSSGLTVPYMVYSDGTRLFVVEPLNHRVLIWNTLPTSNNQSADLVLGQPNFTSVASGLSATSMNTPYAVYSNGTSLFVADYTNHRVLVWNSMPTVNGQAADWAIGQPDLVSNTSNNGGRSGTTLSNPSFVTGDGTHLLIADTGNFRTLIWNTIPTGYGQSANLALGQTNLTNGNPNFSAGTSNILFSFGVYSNGTQVFVSDSFFHRVMVWNTFPTVNGQAADIVLGQSSLTVSGANNGGISASTLASPKAVFSDGVRIFVPDVANNRILGWNSVPTSNGQAADFVLGQPNFTSSTSNNGGITASSLSSATNGFADGARVIVPDYASTAFNNRVLIMPVPGI